VGHSYYKYYCFVRQERLRSEWNRDRILEAIRREGIPCFSGSCSEIYLENVFPPHLRPASRLPVARELGDTSLMLLVHPTLRDEDMVDTVRAIEKVFAAAIR
jgi:dTDP-4-amino-4,6-dideoxygalactose transaminase